MIGQLFSSLTVLFQLQR